MGLVKGEDTITWQEWCDSAAIGKFTRYNRRHVLMLWAKANGAETPQQVLDQIFLDGENAPTPYSTANKLFTLLRDMEVKNATIEQYRSMLGGEGKKGYGGGFFISVLGEENFSTKKFERLCPIGTGEGEEADSTEKKQPTPEELRHILRDLANPRDRVLVGGLACTAFRIGEWVSRKMSELQRRPDGHAAIKIQAGSTKKRYSRYVFLTKEVVDWIDTYHNGLTVEGAKTWILPGEKGNHLDKRSAYVAVKNLFEKAGLTDNPDQGYIYSPHSFRGFAENQMTRAGLEEKFVRLIVGHANEVDRAYKGEYEKDWVEKCSEKMSWLKPLEVVKMVEDTKAREELEKIKALLEFFVGKKAMESLQSKSLEEIKAEAQKAQKQLEDNSKREVGA